MSNLSNASNSRSFFALVAMVVVILLGNIILASYTLHLSSKLDMVIEFLADDTMATPPADIPEEEPVIEEEPVVEEPQVEEETLPRENVIHLDRANFSCTKYERGLRRTDTFEILRAVDYGTSTSKPILVWYHGGGEMLDMDDVVITAEAVIQRMSNMKSSPSLRALVVETLITESDLGREHVRNQWRNLGVAQFLESSAEDTLLWLSRVRPDVHQQVLAFMDDKHSLVYNLEHNVPFSMAMMVQYYWRMCPDLNENIQTVEERASLWKTVYNTRYGMGTVQAYLNRVYAKSHMLAGL